MRFPQIILLCLLACHLHGAESASLPLLNQSTHLRSGTNAEWTEFAQSTPAGRRLDLRFSADSNSSPATLFLDQDDVRQDWNVELNQKRLGQLFLMEARLIHSLPIPAGALRQGSNVLSIVAPRANDDIFLHRLRIEPQALTNAVHQGTLAIQVKDLANNQGLPCRVTIVDTQGALAALVNAGPQTLAIRPGVVYTANGSARLGLPVGDYTIYATRGPEWTTATQAVHITRGKIAPVALQLSRVVSTPGWISCDTHVHTFTHSRHGDATVDERMLTLAGEGLELPIATDHNLHVDFSEAARRLQVERHFTAVTGNEVTTAAGHFNIFPAEPSARVPNPLITDWPRLMAEMRATPNVRVVVLNHPRNIHNNFQPFAATNFNAVSGDNLRGPEFTFDAMEVLNSSAQQTDFMLVYRDWFALLNHGYRIVAVGSSDGHDVSRYIVGQGRTYIAGADAAPGRIDVSAACSNLLAGRALVSMGLIVNMTVNQRFGVGDLATNVGPEFDVAVQVNAPPWMQATNVTLFANGISLRAQSLAGSSNRVQWTLSRPAHDVHLVAIATGPGVTAPFWAIPRPYQPSGPDWEGRVIGSTNPIWLDGDGDGKWTSARGYAKQLIAAAAGNPDVMKQQLRRYDQSVTDQVSSLQTK